MGLAFTPRDAASRLAPPHHRYVGEGNFPKARRLSAGRPNGRRNGCSTYPVAIGKSALTASPLPIRLTVCEFSLTVRRDAGRRFVTIGCRLGGRYRSARSTPPVLVPAGDTTFVAHLDILAFLDESKKPMRDPATGKVAASGDHYVVAAAVVLRGDATTIRNELRDLLAVVSHDLHYSQLSVRRRVVALTGIAGIAGWDGFIYETATPVPARRTERRTRARILSAALPDLTGTRGAKIITLETGAAPKKGFHTLDQHDNATLRSLIARGLITGGHTITHGDKAEPLLWVADLLAGARSDHLCGVDRGTYPLIAHRVSRITTVVG